MEDVAPVRSSYKDVATPASNKTDDRDCISEGLDGYLDLVLKFDIQEIVAALGGVYDGDEPLLTLTGEDLDKGIPRQLRQSPHPIIWRKGKRGSAGT